MKRGITALILLILLLFPLITSEVLTESDSLIITEITEETKDLPEKPKTNPWNETIIISETWQKIIGPFFGLNLMGKSTEISVREVLALISIFIIFFIFILDVLKLTPFFKKKILISTSCMLKNEGTLHIVYIQINIISAASLLF